MKMADMPTIPRGSATGRRSKVSADLPRPIRPGAGAAYAETIQPDPRWIARRRWARAGIIYTLLLACSLLFVGPLLFALLSSLKDNPSEWPPRLDPPQLNPANWAAAWQLGRQGGGNGWFGQFAPGRSVSFEVRYLVPPGAAAVPPQVQVPRRVPGAGAGAVRLGPFAADVAEVSPPQEVSRQPLARGTVVTYRFRIRNAGTVAVDRLPLDVSVPAGQVFQGATLWPSRQERQGRVQSWNNVTAGLIPYVFNNYVRVFRENYSRSTGQNLFLAWIRNSFLLATVRVLTTLVFAAMAGYALARLRFPGRNAVFFTLLFSMMIPSQVLFISNYLVLRDGIWGLAQIWGQQTLLNSFTGYLLSSVVTASGVFIMKQFFESLPASLEEAARIDGAGYIQVFTRVILPLARPALGALTILTFQGTWNEFFWPLVVLTAPQDRFTLTVGLLSFRRTYGVAFDWGPLLAGAIISALPVIILYLVFQRYFVEGISFTGTKG